MRLSRLTFALVIAASLAACQHEATSPSGPLGASNLSGSDRHIVVTPDHLSLAPGDTAHLIAQVLTPENEPLPNAKVAFASGNTKVATVDATGRVLAVAVGSTAITVSSGGAPDVQVPVTVSTGSTHPPDTVAARLTIGSRLFGTAVSTAGVVYLTEPDPQLLQRIDLPTAAFSGSVGVGSQATDVAFDAGGDFAFVTNQLDANVGVVETATNTETATIPVPFNPFRVVAAFDGHSAFVSGNSPVIAVVDRLTGTVTATIPIPDLSNGLALNSTGTKLYASLLFSGAVVEIDVASRTVLRTISIPGAGTMQAVALSRDDAELYVADEGAGQLWIIDLAAGNVSGSVALGGGAFEAKVTPDNVHILVALSGSGVVRVVDRAGRAVVATIATGGVPRRLAFTANGTTAVIANEAGWVDIVR
jgi:YVTN family beta-propeller protein